MEELLCSVLSKNIANYMEEAMSCYMAGAYRGCIVLSYIALFDDLLSKLEVLGKVNRKAKNIYIQADKKKTDQQVFESYLIDQLSSNKLIPEIDTSFLKTLRELRNKSAHPSGHTPSAEEARFIFYESINRFLSKPILSTTQLVDDIISRLKDEHFFPTANLKDIKTIVAEEIESLHEEALPQLITKLTEKFLDDQITISKNSSFFITGLAKINDSSINKLLIKYLLSKKSSDADYDLLIIKIISANGAIYNELSETTCKRLKKIISTHIESTTSLTVPTKLSHPVAFFSSLLRNVTESILFERFEEEFQALSKKYFSSSSLIYSIKNKRTFKKCYIEIIQKMAGSSSFEIANTFSRSIPDIDSELSILLTQKQSFILIVNILSAAMGNAFGAKDLKTAKFNPIPIIKEQAIKYCKSKPDQVEKIIDKKIYEELSSEDFVTYYLEESTT